MINLLPFVSAVIAFKGFVHAACGKDAPQNRLPDFAFRSYFLDFRRLTRRALRNIDFIVSHFNSLQAKHGTPNQGVYLLTPNAVNEAQGNHP
jgi:hypothetical protein